MLDNNELLSILSQPGFHSGSDIGARLGMSRVAVQKRIAALVGQGLPVHSLHGKGYRLDQDIQLLDKHQILNFVGEEVSTRVGQMFVLQNIASTNDYLSSQPLTAGKANICVAEQQSAGRGRRGKAWQSAPYRNVLLSLSWRFKQWPETITGLGLAAALFVTQMLHSKFAVNAKIKWPNDILVNQQKLAGILIDVKGESGGQCDVVLGLGLNVYQPEWQSDEYEWTDLKQLGVEVNRNHLVAGCIEAWLEMLQQFTEEGFHVFRQAWNANSSYANQQIKVLDGEQIIQGTMQGVDEYGALMLEQANGDLLRFTKTDISVRLL